MRELVTRLGPKLPLFFLEGNSELEVWGEKENESKGLRTMQQATARIIKGCRATGSLPEEKSHLSFEYKLGIAGKAS